MREVSGLIVTLLAAAACGDNSSGGVATCAPDDGGITLPSGFCASIFADDVGNARHIATTPNGVVLVSIAPTAAGNDGAVLALVDDDGDGIADRQQRTAATTGNGIAWVDGMLYLAADDRVVRFSWSGDALQPDDATPVEIVGQLPHDGDHGRKAVAAAGHSLYVNFGSASNACQVQNRVALSSGVDPCPELDTRAGIWRFNAAALNQVETDGVRVVTGSRNANALALDPETNTVWAVTNGRDQLADNWPNLFTPQLDRDLPADEMFAVRDGVDRGWPYCYDDPARDQMMLAPEYNGDGATQGRCAAIPPPDVSIAAHAAALGIVFASGTQFPPAYRHGAFIAEHGSSFDPQAVELHGYAVEFVPFANGEPSGPAQPFATGFDAGMRPLPTAAPHRPVGVAMLPDGSLLIGDDTGGRIWRVVATE